LLQEIQTDMDANGYPIQIIGVNEAGFEAGNEDMTSNRTLPLLQDTDDANAWELWEVAYRDVYVMDKEGTVRFRFNLTVHDLSKPENYNALSNALIELEQE
jgi:hypothetical protein